MIHIYILSDPRSGEIFYVGKTVNPKHRRAIHLTPSSHNKAKRERVLEIRESGAFPEFEIVESLDVPDHHSHWGDAEKWWIAYLRSIGCPLTNILKGGQGGRQWSEEELKRMSELAKARATPERRAHQSRKMKGRKVHPQHAENIRKGHVGMKYSEEHRKAISEGQRGRVHPAESRAKIGKPWFRHSEETKRRISEKGKGRKHTPETIEKMRQSWMLRKGLIERPKFIAF